MSAGQRWADRSLAIRLAAFVALSALAAMQWMRLVEAPPVGRVALAVLAPLAGAAALALVAERQPRRSAANALGALAALLATAAGLVAIGVPAHLLDPGSWGKLISELGRGFSGLAGDVKYPYHGENEWSRRVILAGLPVALGLAAALAFWPRRSERGRRTAPLAVLVAIFGVGATIVSPERPLLWGFLLLLGIAAWLWLPGLSRRDAIAAAALVAAAGALALPIAGVLDGKEPRIDFRDWELGTERPTSFNWNHTYGPLDWPRDGTVLAAMKSERPRYWKAAVLDEFDGVRWQRPEQSFGERLELPSQVEGGAVGGATRSDARWIEEIAVTLGPVQSEFVLGAGALISVDGLDNVLSLPNGTTVADGEPLEEGDSYSVLAYAPDPDARRLRAAPDRYPPALARYTELTLPARSKSGGPGSTPPAAGPSVQVPLRGATGGDRAAGRAIAASPYAGMHRLARRLTRREPTAHDAASSIERHLQSSYTYDENTPRHRYPLPAFLSEDRRGYCQQFSGTMALMLRMVGIPSRVVTGFSPGSPDPDLENRYLVEDLDAHSWVEAYFPGIGWTTFDPTPSGTPATGRLGDAELGGSLTGGDAGGGEYNRRKIFTPGRRGPDAAEASSGAVPLWIGPAGLGIVGLLGLLGAAGTTAVRRLRYRSLSRAGAADAHLHELPAALARLGWPLHPAETLLALERRLRSYRKLVAARYVSKLRTGRFSPADAGTPTLAERRALRADLTRADGLRSRLRGLLALPPGGPSNK